MVSVNFFIKNSKKDKHGKVPVNAKIYRSDLDQATLYTGIRISPQDWDGQKVLESDLLHVHYNAIITKIHSDLLKQVRDHMDESTSVIKQFYQDSFKIKYCIGDLVKEYVEMKLEEQTNKETIRTYKTHLKAITAYLKITQLFNHDAGKFAFPQGRIIYSRILKDAKSVIYANKLMWKIKSAIEWGVGERKIDTDHIKGLKLKSVKHKKITSEDYLNLEEVVKLISVEAPVKYNRSKALSTIQIFTGQAFIDVSDDDFLSKIHTIRDKKVMVSERSKTGEEYIVPLDKVAVSVIESYEWHKSRKITNSTYNEHLKVLAAYAGIRKNVTTHMLRRTFAQNSLDGGFSEEVVAKMLGHKDTRMIKFYATISANRILDEYDRYAA